MDSFERDGALALPSAFPSLQWAAQKKLLDAGHARLAELGEQLLGLQISALFDTIPELSRLMFTVSWDYDDCMDVAFCCNLGASGGGSGNPPIPVDPEFAADGVYRCAPLRALLEQEGENDAWNRLNGIELSRPAKGPTAPAILQAFLMPGNFARWQASDLNQDAAAAAPGKSRAL